MVFMVAVLPALSSPQAGAGDSVVLPGLESLRGADALAGKMLCGFIGAGGWKNLLDLPAGSAIIELDSHEGVSGFLALRPALPENSITKSL